MLWSHAVGRMLLRYFQLNNQLHLIITSSFSISPAYSTLQTSFAPLALRSQPIMVQCNLYSYNHQTENYNQKPEMLANMETRDI